MNNSPLPFQKLDTYVVAKELARLTHQAGIRDCELRDQATRAAKSAFLGLCEGLPSDASGIRRRHFDIANNSLHELIGAVDLADAIDAVDGEIVGEADVAGGSAEADAPGAASLRLAGLRVAGDAQPALPLANQPCRERDEAIGVSHHRARRGRRSRSGSRSRSRSGSGSGSQLPSRILASLTDWRSSRATP